VTEEIRPTFAKAPEIYVKIVLKNLSVNVVIEAGYIRNIRDSQENIKKHCLPPIQPIFSSTRAHVNLRILGGENRPTFGRCEPINTESQPVFRKCI
jgi:hypothetical protein